MTLPAVLQSTNFVLTRAGKSAMSLEQFRAEFCLAVYKVLRSSYPGIAAPAIGVTWFHAEFKRAQDSVLELPHAREFLEFCQKQKMRMFLLSSAHEDHYCAQCRSNGFDLFFEHAYTGVWDKSEKIHDLLP